MKLLLTGYEPFGGEEVNPSWEAVKTFKSKNINGIDIVVEEMPVAWNKIEQKFEEAVKTHNPDFIICVGQAGGRNAVAIERIAVNCANGKDNEGINREEQVIKENGKEAYLSTLPIVKMNKAVKEALIPIYISNSAGLYLCNYIFYIARHYIETKGLDIPAGFIHIPYIPEQVAIKDRPNKYSSMDLSLVIKALEEMIKVLNKK
ncbi:MAG: pyroglutamyl-peptidase I [Clostridia bacterium]